MLELMFAQTAFSQDFRINSIRFQGLQRVSGETALSYMPVKQGQLLTDQKMQQIIDDLYQTGFFSKVNLARDGNTLVVIVQERPTIGLITFSGNKIIKKKQLQDVLKQAGIQEGLTYNPLVLSGLKQALLQQYYNLGRYNAHVTTEITQEPRNRVGVKIKIYEGQTAKVKQITILGAKHFSQKKLLKQFSLTTPHIWSFITQGDQFSRDKLDKDLESLHNFYLDNGYLRFKIDSAQVAVTPDRRSIYLTIHVTEGPQYHLSGYTVVGDTAGQSKALNKIAANLKMGEVFSRAKVLAIDQAMKQILANHGYALARIDVLPTVDDNKHMVYLTFDLKPGDIIYVHRISYVGNTKTNDEVLRRETRQMEGAAYNGGKVDESKRRISLLGYLTNVTTTMEPVPNKKDQVDLQYHVKETSTATASANVGYSDAYGLMYGASIVQNNFMGSGKSVSLGFNRSAYVTSGNFSYFNPYYTKSGISRGFSVYAQRVTPGDVNIIDYKSDVFGGSMDYRFPLSEYDYLSASIGYEYLKIKAANGAVPPSVFNFLATHGSTSSDGNEASARFNETRVSLGWTHTTYDRAIYPTKGISTTLGGTVGLPISGSAVEYYKLVFNGKAYIPLDRSRKFIVRLSTDLGYGNGYGRFSQLPFFRNFYAGGIDSVSGYAANSLGPQYNGDALGGNVKTVGEAALIFPNLISQTLRTALIFDAGNIYQDEFNPRNLRMSAGLEINWLSPMGPLKFTVAYPLNAKSGDDKNIFQFTVGASL